MEGKIVMKEITITPDLLRRYSKLHKNDILFHMFLKATADENGRVKRNVLQFSKQIGITEQRVRDAEYRNKQNGLLRIHVVSGKRFWYVYDQPISVTAPIEEPIIATPTTSIEESPKPRSIWYKIRHVIGWTHERKKP